MKKSVKFLMLMLTAVFVFSISSCREKTTGEKIEDGVEEVGEDVEDAVDDAGDEIEDAVDDN
ncbi:hypothetical protein FGM00_18250 [Aggregatimonas sangjinii]|uniref:Uncharacterized protein n=1 Tax=Aggregatimonas sangjinii TaxID=2583587 RepID=A0A5B7SYH1_9FLAO|nr:hypothetical protein [Aggregatimonas sangjinii]QCX01961.1 hypothetical protein FGM00_18250 [Aggregatimonas sangjinii]